METQTERFKAVASIILKLLNEKRCDVYEAGGCESCGGGIEVDNNPGNGYYVRGDDIEELLK